MADNLQGSAVNAHYLKKVMDMTDEMEVKATEDIYDARGNKLLAKGARVSRKLQEKLVVHKLKKPLEACILVEGGVDERTITAAAQRLADTSPAIAHIVGRAGGGKSCTLRSLSRIRFGSAMGTMLTMTERAGPAALDHAVTVSLLSIGLAARTGLTDDDQQISGLAGLLHDVGELYIDPAYLVRGKRLLPHEWAHLVIHPHTGQMLITELEAVPDKVGRAVAEHHERFDGSGYPRRSAAQLLSQPGQIVSLAETIGGVLSKDRPLERAALALKIIPGEHRRSLLAAIGESLSGAQLPQLVLSPNEARSGAESTNRLLRRISYALSVAGQAISGPGARSAQALALLNVTVARIHIVQRALISTGMDLFSLSAHADDEEIDASLLFEQEVITREIQWRLRDIARDLALWNGSPNDRLLFVPLINVLDDDFSPEAYEPAQAPPGRVDASYKITQLAAA